MMAWVLSQAAYGARWAQCAGWMFVFAACLFGLYAGVFLLAKVLSGLIRRAAIHPYFEFSLELDNVKRRLSCFL